MAALPRGLKNKNPGNIIKGGNPYQGEVIPSQDSRFRQFKTIQYGYRALFHLLATYITKYQWNTIEKIISHWAPSNENNTQKYIVDVVKWSGIPEQSILAATDYAKLTKIAYAISLKENGIVPSETEIKEGLTLLLNSLKSSDTDDDKKKI